MSNDENGGHVTLENRERSVPSGFAQGTKPMRLVLESRLEGAHRIVKVRMGPQGAAAAACGNLIMVPGEWQLFGAAVSEGARIMFGHLKVEIVDL